MNENVGIPWKCPQLTNSNTLPAPCPLLSLRPAFRTEKLPRTKVIPRGTKVVEIAYRLQKPTSRARWTIRRSLHLLVLQISGDARATLRAVSHCAQYVKLKIAEP